MNKPSMNVLITSLFGNVSCPENQQVLLTHEVVCSEMNGSTPGVCRHTGIKIVQFVFGCLSYS